MDNEQSEIIEECREFLKKSDERYQSTVSRALDDLKIYSNDFWSDDMRKTYRKRT